MIFHPVERCFFELFYIVHRTKQWLATSPSAFLTTFAKRNDPVVRLERKLDKASLLRWRFPDEAESVLDNLGQDSRLLSVGGKGLLDRIRVERIKIEDRRRWMDGERKS